jgi:hypothetical protein
MSSTMIMQTEETKDRAATLVTGHGSTPIRIFFFGMAGLVVLSRT